MYMHTCVYTYIYMYNAKAPEEILDRLRSNHRATGSRTCRDGSVSHKTNIKM